MKPNSTLKQQAGPKQQSGSVILEAMIAILIFSIGILGLVGMQATAVSNVSDAKYRADAAFFANQIIGQMWASRVVAGASYVPDPTYAWPNAGANTTVIAWASGVAGFLPQGNATVTIDPVGQQKVTVTIGWVPPKAVPHSHVTVTYIE